MNEFVEHRFDLGYTIAATPGEYQVDFEVFRLAGPGPEVHYLNDGCVAVTDWRQADCWLRGFVKWDGCSNWLFPDNVQNHMLHFCHRDSLLELGQLLALLYDMAAKHCPRWRR